MLKCHIVRGKKAWVKAAGTAEDLMVETGALIKQIHNNIEQASPEAAAGYKSHLLGLLLDPNSPVWKKEETTHG